MEYNKTSIDEVVGRVIRNTKIPDTSAYADILVWITEAMRDMGTKWQLRQVWQQGKVHFYKAAMPCGLQVLTAIEYDGQRLQQKNTSRHPSMAPEFIQDPTGSGIWISAVAAVESPSGFTTYQQINRSIPIVYDPREWYEEDGPGYLSFSFEEGDITFHYKEVPHDKKGWPIIPDQENYKEALYWYCRMKLIEAGWQDPVLSWEVCDQKYSINAERGRAAIKFPSTNRMEELCDMVSLIPPQNYFDSFGDFYQPYSV